MKHLKFAAAALLCVLTFTACADEEVAVINPPSAPEKLAQGAFVLNQGNAYDLVGGSLDYLDYEAGTYTPGLFKAANGIELGDGPQDGVVYGSKLYVALFNSKAVWVINAADGKAVKRIPVTDPEGICAADGKVFVSNNDGYVTSIDTLSLEASPQRTAVGPNPVGMVAANGFVYVAVSDGYNSTNGYANGFTVAKLRTADLSVAGSYRVGMNPTGLAADEKGNVFVVCNGNYGLGGGEEVKPQVWKLTPDGVAAPFVPGSQIAVSGRTLYVVYNYTNYTTYLPEPVTYKAYDTLTGQVTNGNFVAADNCPPVPVAIDADPKTGEVFITSDYAQYDYTSPGYVYRYAPDGTFVSRYEAGIHPYAVVFR